MANTPELTVDITPKVVKVTAFVELYVGGRCVGTTTVDLTPQGDSEATRVTAEERLAEISRTTHDH